MSPASEPAAGTPEEALHAAIGGGWVLPPPVDRVAVHTRSIVCRSFRRRDGMVDIDGRFIDTRAFGYDSEMRGWCEPGEALHNMQLRLTVDRTRHIRAVVSAMPGTPYEMCPGVNGQFQNLVGLSIARGFKRALRERLGGVEGCTHMGALLEAMAAAAVQTFASDNRAPRLPGEVALPVRVFSMDALLNTCHSYREGSPVVAALVAIHAQREAEGKA